VKIKRRKLRQMKTTCCNAATEMCRSSKGIDRGHTGQMDTVTGSLHYRLVKSTGKGEASETSTVVRGAQVSGRGQMEGHTIRSRSISSENIESFNSKRPLSEELWNSQNQSQQQSLPILEVSRFLNYS